MTGRPGRWCTDELPCLDLAGMKRAGRLVPGVAFLSV